MSFIKKYWHYLLVPIILGIMFTTMYLSSKGDSSIVDEIAHIPSGYSYITTGDYRLNPEHPPLIKDLAAIPLLAMDVAFPYDYWRSNNPVINNQWQMGWKFLYETPGNNPDAMLAATHIPMMLLSVFLGFLVFSWARKLFGPKAGVFALTLYAFDSSIIAHSRFVTTDLGISLALFLNIFTVYYYLKKPTLTRMFLAALTFFIALVTKFSVAILGPVYAIFFLMLVFRKGTEKKTDLLNGIFNEDWKKRFVSALVSFAVICISGVLMMWAFYFFHTMNMPADVQKGLIYESMPKNIVSDTLASMSGNPVTKPLAQWLLGFSMVAGHVEGGHDAFLLGQTSNKGWWYYYPVTIALKTAIPVFIFLLLWLLFRKKLQIQDWFTEVYLWVLPVVLLAMGMQGSINLGIRYMLPLFPFLYVAVSRVIDLVDFSALFEKTKKNFSAITTTVVMVLLLVWYVSGSLLTYPYYLSYFNEFVGGYKNGYKYLTDSNLDWGQDVKRLADWIKNSDESKQHKCQYQTYVDVFPGSMPAAYYIGRNRMIEWHVQNGQPKGCFAVSATFYQNSKMKKDANGGMDYAWLDKETPIENIGGSILIYDLK